MIHRGFTLLAFLAALVAPAGPAVAQSLVGRVVAEDSDAPLRGVFLTLTDSTGHRAVGTLSRPDGSFVLRAPGPGTYLVRLELIGYRGTSETVRIAADTAEPRTFRMPLEAVELDGLLATSERGACTVRPAESAALVRLWDAARQALRLAEWSAESGWLRASGYTYQRVLQLTDREVLAERVRRIPAMEPAAFAAVEPALARDQGFVVATQDGALIYRGADATLLLSDEFLDTHCFTLRQRPEEGLVGLGFEPVPGREVAEIQGVLWLDAQTARLQSLEYGYTEYYVPIPLPPSRFGGFTEFRHLPDGSVSVQRWWISMPRLLSSVHARRVRQVRRCDGHACEDPDNLQRLADLGLAIEEEGGTVLSYRFPDGTRLPAAERAAISGVVMDSTVGAQPARLSGAQVSIVGTEERAVTDASGRFRFDDLDEGTYRLTFEHPRMVEIGVAQPGAVVVEASSGGVAEAELGLPSPGTLALGRCGALASGAPDPSARIVYGQVRDRITGEAIRDATVQATASGADEPAEAIVETTNAAGEFLFCDLSEGDVSLTAHFLGKGSETRGVRIRPGDPVETSFTLLLSQAAQVRGRVVAVGGSTGVPGTTVRVAGTDLGAVTDGTGRFAFDSVPPGALTLETEHVAYRGTTGHLAVRGGEMVEIELLVAEEVFELEPIVVTARSSPLLNRPHLGGFHIRRARSVGGTFYGPEDFELRPYARATDFLQGTHGLRVDRGRGFGALITSTRHATLQGAVCPVAIFLDGTRITSAFGRGSNQQEVAMIEQYTADELAGIEVYAGPSTLPGEFAGSGTDCGVIAVWTRTRDRSGLRPDGLVTRP